MDSTFQVAREWGILPNVLCPTNETFEFLENVLKEVIDIFPGQYIHIGGDECPREQWNRSDFCHALMRQHGMQTFDELQTWFMRRISQFLQSHGRKAIGWDEIIDGGAVEGAVIMSWRGEEGGIAAAGKGNNVIMTPHRFFYLDYYQWRLRDQEPLAQGGYLPLSMVYMYDPVPNVLTDEQKKRILGAQGNLWTEYIKDFRHVEYMAYPRACAIAETTWTPADKKSYDQFLFRMREYIKDFRHVEYMAYPRACAIAETTWTPADKKSYDQFLFRMREYSKRLDIMNVNFARHFLGR